MLVTCSRELDAVSAPGDLVVVATSSLAVDGGIPNNYQEPVVFYLADRKGWSLPADWHDPARLADNAAGGARWFVEPVPSLIIPGGPLASWLAVNARQVRSVAADGCDVWALNPAR